MRLGSNELVRRFGMKRVGVFGSAGGGPGRFRRRALKGKGEALHAELGQSKRGAAFRRWQSEALRRYWAGERKTAVWPREPAEP